MIDTLIANPVLAAAVLTAGLIVGLLLGWLLFPGTAKARRLQKDLEALRAEHGRYRGEVTQHFRETAERIGTLTTSYKALYDHLASGAQALVEGEASLLTETFTEPRALADARATAAAKPAAPRPERPIPAAEARREPTASAPAGRTDAKPEPAATPAPAPAAPATAAATRPAAADAKAGTGDAKAGGGAKPGAAADPSARERAERAESLTPGAV